MPINFLVAIVGEGDRILEEDLDFLALDMLLDQREPYKIKRSKDKKGLK